MKISVLLPTLNNIQVNTIIENFEVLKEQNDIPIENIRELISFSYGSPGRYIKNLQSWLGISSELRQKLEIKLTNQIEILKLAKEISDELNVEQQLWLIDFQQNKIWRKEKNAIAIKKLEELRKQILNYVQPRLAWEVTLLEINFLN